MGKVEMSESRGMRRYRGQALVEYALVVPLLLLLTFGIIDFAIVVLQYNTIANAAREGARAGVVPGANEDDVVAAAEALTTGLKDPDISVTLDEDIVSVTVEYEAQLITGIVIQAVGGSGEIPLSSTSTMRRE